jgi:molybdopterin-guanine dinucleotide biosynthesis protein A
MGGFHKALLAFDREKMIDRQIRLMKEICAEVIVVTNEPQTFLPLVDRSVRIITDYLPNSGPLGGMHAALSLAKYSDVWIVACDMPFLSPPAAELMLQRKKEQDFDAVIPVLAGRWHPLHGIYDKRSVRILPEMINKGDLHVRHFLTAIHCGLADDALFSRHGIDLRFVFNVNTPEDYREALSLMTGSGKQAAKSAETGQ